VAEVVSNAEKDAVEQLGRDQPDRKAILAWCPVETHMTRHSQARRRKRYSVPLLPGYVFVRLPVDADGDLLAGEIDALREASPLVKGLVGASGKPRPVADRWIAALETAERLGAFDYQPRGRPNYSYAKGEKVRILSGVMTNRIAEFVCNKSGRLKLLLEPIDAAGQVIVGGKPISTKVASDQVEPVEPPPLEPTPAEQGLWPPPPGITA
jgi:transcription antitermination factor NusG